MKRRNVLDGFTEYFERFKNRSLTTVVPDLKVNTYFREYTDNGEIYIDPDTHVFRIDIQNHGAQTARIAFEGADGNNTAYYQFGAKMALPWTIENHPAYGRKDNWSINFTGAGTKACVIVIHVLE